MQAVAEANPEPWKRIGRHGPPVRGDPVARVLPLSPEHVGGAGRGAVAAAGRVGRTTDRTVGARQDALSSSGSTGRTRATPRRWSLRRWRRCRTCSCSACGSIRAGRAGGRCRSTRWTLPCTRRSVRFDVKEMSADPPYWAQQLQQWAETVRCGAGAGVQHGGAEADGGGRVRRSIRRRRRRG